MSPGATSTKSIRAIRLSPDGFSSPVARIRARGGWAGRSESSDFRRPRPAPLAAARSSRSASPSSRLRSAAPGLKSSITKSASLAMNAKRSLKFAVLVHEPGRQLAANPGPEVLLQQGSQSGLEPARRPIDEHAEVSGAEDASPDRAEGRHRYPVASEVQHCQTRANGIP